jgi:hypothetical protein
MLASPIYVVGDQGQLSFFFHHACLARQSPRVVVLSSVQAEAFAFPISSIVLTAFSTPRVPILGAFTA